MKIVFCCFSGSGNTLDVCRRLAAELEARGHAAEIFPIRAEAPLPSLSGCDRLVIAYPVHAFNAPAPVVRFLKRLPAGNCPAYLLRTSGEPSKLNNASGISPKRILAKKGYSVSGELHYVMPYNIIFRHSDGMAARMDRAASISVRRDASAVESGGGNLDQVGPLRRFAAFLLRIEHPAMPAIGRTFRVSKDCVGCGLCAKVCPQGNIALKDGKPAFGWKCVGCMGCAFRCPKDAIRTSLLNGWRVNGAYSYSAEPASDGEICRYCRKMYTDYFHAVEESRE